MNKEQFKNSIGKDVYWKLQNSDNLNRVHWQDWLNMDWNYIDVSQEYRINKLSESD